jgi:hypothetical protein
MTILASAVFGVVLGLSGIYINNWRFWAIFAAAVFLKSV